jgi:hypothetical protein
MTRALVQALLLFALPFLGYALWLHLVRRERPVVASTPWFWLTLSGLVLVCAGFVALTLVGASPAGGVYEAPHLGPDGRVVPGAVRPRDGGG